MASLLLACLLSMGLGAAGCSSSIPEADRQSIDEPKVSVFFNSTGTRHGNAGDLRPSDFLVERIDSAESSVHVAAYGFEKHNVAQALVDAHERGVEVKFVGSTSHLDAEGYQMMLEEHIPMQVGNEYHIMHNKFFIIDQRFVFVGTGNITPTGFGRNNNNWVWMESEPVAADFEAEFQQMFNGKFSSAKTSPNDVNTYQIGDTTVEIYFSPQERTVSRMLEEIRKVDTSLYFQIFAFTKDSVGSAFVAKHRELMEENEAYYEQRGVDDWREMSPRKWPHHLTGILDRSQVYGNNQYHEAYRLTGFGVPMRLDANENSVRPGDYQAGGGRLHTKTMILDPGTEDARVITGSFNWSSSATLVNDEVMIVLRGERIAERYMSMYDELWSKSKSLTGGLCHYLKRRDQRHQGESETPKEQQPLCADEVEPGDVVFSEVHWDGWNGLRDPSDHAGKPYNRDRITNDEFIELYNTTDRPIDLSMWTITNGADYKVGFTPGTIIEPNEYYLLLDHNTESYSDHAFKNGDFVLNTANDPRFHNLNLKNSSLYLDLRPVGFEKGDTPIDVAGNGGPPFRGGRDIQPVDAQYDYACSFRFDACREGESVESCRPKRKSTCNGKSKCNWNTDEKRCRCSENLGQFDDTCNQLYEVVDNRSMERIIRRNGDITDGTKASNWRAAQRPQNGNMSRSPKYQNIRDEFRDKIVATPGAPNSVQ